MEFCTNPDVLRILLFAKDIVHVVFIILPIAIIIMTMIDFFKNVSSLSADDKNKKLKTIIKRIIYCIIVFAVPFIVKIVVNVIESVFEEELNYNGCLANANSESIDFYQKLYDEEEERRNLEEERKKIRLNEEKDVLDLVGSSTATNEQSMIGAKYNLSNEQLEFLATVAQKEQGSVDGAIAEACLMANLFELKANKSKFGTGADGLYNYVATGGWFGDAKERVRKYLQNNKLRAEVKAAVKYVLVDGYRPYPIYIDEHDCWDCNTKNYCSGGVKGDICRIKNNDKEYSSITEIKNRSNYKQDETKIYNVYGDGKNDYYTFYEFPTSKSDPFGYTQSSLNRYKKLNNGG